jgi:phosphoserine phosphatase RsbU/P
MDASAVPYFRDQLLDRRARLEGAVARKLETPDVTRLLSEIDAALGRMDAGSFGLCETCHDHIEADRLLTDPLTRFCLDHLTPSDQRALEQDLALAARVQRELLPKADVCFDGWDLAYHYEAAGPVSGDYCDVLPGPGSTGDHYFLIGDVSGHGVAAAMLMSHLSALLRTLIAVKLPLPQIVERASRVFCESTLPSHYATLVCGRAERSGQVELCNAGHPPPLLVRHDRIESVAATGLPLGLFCTSQFASCTVHLEPKDMLLLYTDGLTDAVNPTGELFGGDRLHAVARERVGVDAKTIVGTYASELSAFRRGRSLADDVTVLALRRD